jgi:hypothetical protein
LRRTLFSALAIAIFFLCFVRAATFCFTTSSASFIFSRIFCSFTYSFVVLICKSESSSGSFITEAGFFFVCSCATSLGRIILILTSAGCFANHSACTPVIMKWRPTCSEKCGDGASVGCREGATEFRSGRSNS